MDDICHLDSDWFVNALATFLIIGLVVSYSPQHLRIIQMGSSEGFSPWFLLLGSTSSAAGMLNMIALTWPTIQCCNDVSVGRCLEITAGVTQVVLQWVLFTAILVLYMIYYPARLKYVDIDIPAHGTLPPQHVKTKLLSNDWRLSVNVSWVVTIHLVLITTVTFFLLFTRIQEPGGDVPRQISLWATFLGVSSALLAAIQYAPQLLRTYRSKLVGALSIPMMILQSPGAFIMSVSIGLRPGTNWTSWAMYAVSGIMQSALLVMCIAWKFRQRRLKIDDFGYSLDSSSSTPLTDDVDTVVDEVSVPQVGDMSFDSDSEDAREDVPLLAKPRRSGRSSRFFSWLKV
ncbi:uncharacterized protein EDB93DRAFT_1114541 [Suillus bovinus]|uniref:uncharacterized protein n=1 Tax=Suillus bovinus TaxID=48563 RepID=UPI001B85ECCD|nr:uncharacterized protein EDB93DRAFT_1114541 [Suillus bovinus]KAG2159237.1 hypothetical protein EDB93DRAFT_1114541 [Suillus bovinus]